MLFILSTIIGLMLYDSSDGIIKIKIPNEQPKPEKSEWKFIFLEKKKYFPHQKKGTLTTVFEYYNNTPNVQVIDHVRTSCGCTKVDFSHFPIKPRERGGIRVFIDLNESGAFSKSVAIYFHGQKPVILKIIGNIYENAPEII